MIDCDCCARWDSFMYRNGCDRCEARAWARALEDGGTRTVAYVAQLAPHMRALIEEERVRISTSEAA